MRKKTLILILIGLVGILVGLTGCDATFVNDAQTGIMARASMNTSLIDKMQIAGLLDKQSADELKAGVKKTAEDACNKISGDGTELQPYISWITTDPNTKSLLELNNITVPSTTKSLSLISDDYAQKIGAILDYKVYTLKGDVDIDAVSSYIKTAKSALDSGDASKIRVAFDNLSVTNKYFQDSGQTLLSMDNINQSSVLRDSKFDLNAKDDIGIDFKVNYNKAPVIAVRLKEFDKAVVDKLINLDGVADSVYLVDRTNKVIYKMVYPVYSIDTIDLDSSDTNKYKTAFTSSAIYYANLLTGKLTSDETGAQELVQGDDVILKVGPDTEGAKQSSFIMKGDKVILRDYLECNYLPGVVADEKWVALGRRIRVTNFSGNRKDPLGYIINKKGEAVDNGAIYTSDLLSILTDSDTMSEYKGMALKLGKESDNISNAGGGSQAGVDEDDSGSAKEKINLLKEKFSPTIYPILKLGCPVLAKQDTDAGTNGKPLLKGICVSKNPFESNIYKAWISGDDTDYGNLPWWNEWLKNHKFAYQIDANALNQALADNYQFEMQQLGYIIIDKDTIRVIQEKYNQEDKENRVSWIRTMFIILGIALMAYSIILVASWVFDVNLISGPKLMNTLTFGKWEAIADSSELPNMEVGDKSYMTFSNTLRSSLIIMAIGFLLVAVDVVAIVLGLIKTFGGLSDVVSRMIFGTK